MTYGDAREWKWRGNWRMEWVASTLHATSEHGVSSITIVDAHNSSASSRLNWRPRRFKWTRPFRRNTKAGFCACAITYQTQSTQGDREKRCDETWVWCGFDRASSIISGNKLPTRSNRWIFIADLIACSTCFGTPLCPSSGAREYYTSGHTTRSYTLYRQLENQAPNTTDSNHLYNTLELLMMDIIVSETCWASNKIYNRNLSLCHGAHNWQFC
jgi:hypothetical protein